MELGWLRLLQHRKLKLRPEICAPSISTILGPWVPFPQPGAPKSIIIFPRGPLADTKNRRSGSQKISFRQSDPSSKDGGIELPQIWLARSHAALFRLHHPTPDSNPEETSERGGAPVSLLIIMNHMYLKKHKIGIVRHKPLQFTYKYILFLFLMLYVFDM